MFRKRWLVAFPLMLFLPAAAALAQLTDAQKYEILARHNLERCNVNTAAATMPPLVWDDRLAQVAQNFANTCQGIAHNPNRSTDYAALGGSGYVGENTFGSGGTSDPGAALQLWAAEKTNFTYPNSCTGVCAHYTQMIWANTTAVGCGISNCPASPWRYIMVCNYAPGGNSGGAPYPSGMGSNAACGATSYPITATSVFSSQNPSQTGQSVTFSATVATTPPGPIPDGTVLFKDGELVLGSGTLNGSGVAQVTTSNLSAGNQLISAFYQGSGSFQPSSSSPLVQTVQGIGTVRTWVATTGADSNPCSRALPCRTFAAAAEAVNAGGEVVVLDSGGYGAVTLTRSVSVTSPEGVHAAVAPSIGNAIVINADPADLVVLRGLYLNSQGAAGGIVFNSGGALQVENCVVSGFAGRGIDFLGAGELSVRDSILRGNLGHGIRVQPVSGQVAGLIERTRMEGNESGLTVVNGRVDVRDSVAARNQTGFSAATQSKMTLDRVAAIGNGVGVLANAASSINVFLSRISMNSIGIRATGAGGFVTCRRSSIDGNVLGIATDSGGVTVSHLRNAVAGNGSNGSFTVSFLPN